MLARPLILGDLSLKSQHAAVLRQCTEVPSPNLFCFHFNAWVDLKSILLKLKFSVLLSGRGVMKSMSKKYVHLREFP